MPLVASEHNQISWPAGDHTLQAREAARRIDLFFAHGPLVRAWVAGIGLETGCATGVRWWGVCPPGHCPGLPRPRLTFAGRFRGDKAPEMLIEALALLGAPPPAYLIGDGPHRGPLIRLVAPAGWSCRTSARMVVPPARYIAGSSVHVVPVKGGVMVAKRRAGPGARSPGHRHRG